MATYRIEWKKSAVRELRRLDHQVIARVVAVVGLLAADPYPRGVRKLSGTENTYRVRVGDYRIVYEVLDRDLLIQIARVRHRKDAYRM